MKQLTLMVLNSHNQEQVHAKKLNPNTAPSHPMVYRIRIRGYLAPHWSEWFEGVAIMLEDNGDTLLTAPAVVRATLYGVVRKVCDLGIYLLAVICVTPGQADTANVTP